MNLTLAAIEKNRITVVVLAVILLSGTLAFFDMERAEDPGFVIRDAVVITYFPGASSPTKSRRRSSRCRS
jgi:multidrug efflux pump subunit AcrB